jgi:uncharacterized membrane protein YraQ (UPF0718 family)
MTSIILYSLAGILLFVSFVKDKEKTKKSLMVAWKSFMKLLPNALAIMLIVGITLSILNQQTISGLIGERSGILGVLIALTIGSITMIPSFVAFPLGGALLTAGAGLPQVAALISTVMAVGIVTLPMEIKYFNRSVAIKRNILTFIVCVIFTVTVWVVM